MANEVEYFTKWIPVVATLGGATLGFSASLLTTWFNNRAINLRSKDDRNRNRLELIYELLIEVQYDYFLLTKKVMSYSCSGKKISLDKIEKISSSRKLEMIIFLYFPEFKEELKSLENAQELFGREFVKILLISTGDHQLSELQNLTSKVIELNKMVNEKVVEFQQAIITTIQI